MPMRRAAGAVRARCLQLIPFAAALLACTSSEAVPFWRTPWTIDAPPHASLLAPGTTPGLEGIAFAGDGDVLLGTQGFYGYQDAFITRIAPDGTLRWNGVVHAWNPPAAVVPLPDGGAYATFNTPAIWGGFAARLDANGSTLWARDVPARWLVPIDADRVAVSDCEALSMLDAATGVVLWNRTLSPSGNCGGDGLVVDGSTMYAFGLTWFNYQAEVQHLVAYSLDGTLRWQADLDTGTSVSTFPSLVGVSAGRLYVRTDEETIAVDASNGSVVWRVPEGGLLLAGAAREPIVSAPDGLERLDAADGHARWEARIGSYVTPVTEIGGAIVAVSGSTLYRVDSESGETTWSVALPDVDPPGAIRYWTAIGGIAADGTFSLAGHTDFRPFVQRVDFATGALGPVVPAPSIAQGIYGNSVRDAGDIVGYHFDDSDVLRLIDVDAGTGAIRWNVATPFGEDLRPVYAYTGDVQIATGSLRVAAAVPLNDDYSSYPFGFVEVASYDRAGGDLAWNASLLDWTVGESQASVSAPIVDAAGNVIVSVGMMVSCTQVECPEHSIYKLAAADGSVLWRVDDDLYGPTDAKRILALGDDVLVYGPFAASNATLRRLSGADGSVQWESDVFAPDGVANVYRNGDSRLVAFASSTGPLQWTALDAATGAVAWASTAPCDVNANCNGDDGLVLPAGDLMLPTQPGANASLVELATDGTGATASWPLAPGSPDLYTWLWGLDAEDDGTIDFVLQRYGNSGAGLWAGRFDRSAPSDTSYQRIAGLPLGGLASARLALDSVIFDARPAGSEYSLEDMAITASGNLVASVALDRSVASPGSYVGFRMAVTYTGDAAIGRAELRGKMPWPSGAIDLSCTGSGVSNCALDATGRDVVATFDIEPGGTLEVTGRILVLDFPQGEARKLGARVVGPPGLDETDTIDNFTFATFTQALFASGFDD